MNKVRLVLKSSMQVGPETWHDFHTTLDVESDDLYKLVTGVRLDDGCKCPCYVVVGSVALNEDDTPKHP